MHKPLLIGLGNPGKKYAATRHNVGKSFIHWMKDRLPATSYRLELIKSLSFMNESGKFVKKMLSNFNVILSEELASRRSGSSTSEGSSKANTLRHGGARFFGRPQNDGFPNLLVAHDDLDLSLGQFKIQFGRGPRDHKGLLSIYQSLGTKKFWHIRIGIDNRNNCHCEEFLESERSRSRRSATRQSSVSDVNIPIGASRLDSSRTLRMTAKRESGEIYTLKPFKREEKIVLLKTFTNIKTKLISMLDIKTADVA